MKFNRINIFFILMPFFLNSCTYQNAGNISPKSIDGITPAGQNLGEVPDTVSLSIHIYPIFDKYNCRDAGCHASGSVQGGVNLANYNGIKIVASNGKLYNSVAQNGKATPMPSTIQKLNSVELATIKKWIDNGFLNN